MARPALGTGAYAYDWLSGGGYNNTWGTSGWQDAYNAWLTASPEAAKWAAGTPEWHRSDFQKAWDEWIKDNPAATVPQPSAAVTDLGNNIANFKASEYKVEYGPNGEVWLVEYSYPAISDPNDPNYGKPGAPVRKVVKDYTELYNEVRGIKDEMENRGISNFDQWLSTTGRSLGDTTSQLASLTDLKSRLQGTDQDNIDAWNNAAAGMGLSGAELSNALARLTMNITGLDENTLGMTPQELADYYAANPDAQKGIIASQQGLSQEELALRERLHRNSMREMRAASQKMLDNALGSSNSRSRYLMQADQYMTQIRDQDLQQQLAISQEDSARRQQEYQASLQTWSSMYQAGQMGKEQFLSNIRQNRSLEMQVTATEISTIMQQNQQYLQMYGADLQAFELYSQNLFNSIQTEMGMDANLLNQTSELYAQALAPLATMITQYDKLYTEYQDQYQQWVDTFLTPLEAQKDRDNATTNAILGGVFKIFGDVIGALLGGIDFGKKPNPSGTAVVNSVPDLSNNLQPLPSVPTTDVQMA